MQITLTSTILSVYPLHFVA